MELPPRHFHRPQFNPKSGFTLIEILVSCGITMILMMIVISIVNGVLDQSQRIRHGSESNREATAAIEVIAADLEALFIPRQGDGSGLLVGVETVNGVLFPWVTLLSQAPDSDPANHTGTPRGISLRAGYLDPVPDSTANPRFGLYRTVTSAADTFVSLFNLADPQTGYWSTSGAPDSREWQNLLADRLHSLHIRFQRADTGEWIDPTANGDAIRIDHNGSYSRLSGGAEVAIPGGFTAIEISLVVLDEHGDRRLREGAFTRDSAAQTNGHHFTRRTVLLPRNAAPAPSTASSGTP